jgi:hypothetical protein
MSKASSSFTFLKGMKLSLESCRLLGYDQTSFSFFPHQCVNYKYKFSSTSSFPLNTATRGFIRSFNYKIIHPLKLNGLCAVEIGSSALICKLRTTTRIRQNKTTRRLTTFGESNWRRKQRAIQFEFESISPLLYIPRRDLFHFSEYIWHNTSETVKDLNWRSAHDVSCNNMRRENVQNRETIQYN